MSKFSKEASFAERLKTAAAAKKAQLESFKAKPAVDDPAVVAREAERKRVAEARAARAEARAVAEAQRLAQEAVERAQREAALEAERIEQEKAALVEAEARVAREAEEAELAALADAEKKAARDARYAARKARKRGGLR